MTDETATPTDVLLVASAWNDASKRYLSIWGNRASNACLVFDRETETVVFRATSPEGWPSASVQRCKRFITERCAEAALTSLRNAGLLR